MEVSYLKAVLRAGLGTAFSEDTQSRNKPFSLGVQLQQPIQNRFPFSKALWDNEDELEDVAEEVVFDTFFGNTSSPAKPGPMDDQASGAEQKVESDRYLPKPTTDTNEEIVGEDSFAQDISLHIRKKAGVDLHSTSELKMGRSDVRKWEKEVKEDKSGAQNIANKIDIQQIEVKRVQSKENDVIPTVEVVKQTAIRVPSSDQLSSPSSVSQMVEINLPSQEPNWNQQAQQLKESTSQQQKSHEQIKPLPQKTIIAEAQEENIRIPSDMAKQEKVHESEALMKSVKVLRKPTSRDNLNAFFFTKSLKKSETQTAKIAKDIALIKKKLDEHISKEQPEPVRPVFLPKRPASRNLGGWSNLERNYVR